MQASFNRVEKDTYKVLVNLAENQKRVMWDLINKANNDGVVHYTGKKDLLRILIEKDLIRINAAYRGWGHSLFVLPRCQSLISKLKIMYHKKLS